jgi:hypothetical protein
MFNNWWIAPLFSDGDIFRVSKTRETTKKALMEIFSLLYRTFLKIELKTFIPWRPRFFCFKWNFLRLWRAGGKGSITRFGLQFRCAFCHLKRLCTRQQNNIVFNCSAHNHIWGNKDFPAKNSSFFMSSFLTLSVCAKLGKPRKRT